MPEVQPRTSERFLNFLYVCINMSERKTVPVSLPKGVSKEIDDLVEEGRFGSRSEALRYAARLLTHQEATKRLHELTHKEARKQAKERMERKDVPGY